MISVSTVLFVRRLVASLFLTTQTCFLLAQADGESPEDSAAANTRIAFASRSNLNLDIYLMNPDGSDIVRLTDNAKPGHVPGHMHPDWSPDGTRIAYTTDPEKQGWFSVWVMNADGSDQTRLTDKSRNFLAPKWSPDGKKIIFAERNRDGLFIMNSDGSGRRRLTFTKDSHVAWLPDGSGFACYSANSAQGGGLYIINLDRTVRGLLIGNAQDAISDWSPDGSTLAVNLERDDTWSTFVMNADGSEMTRLNNVVAEHTTLSWSPNGAQLAYVSDEDGNFEIYVMDADGSHQRRLTHNSHYDADPAWSPYLHQSAVKDDGAFQLK